MEVVDKRGIDLKPGLAEDATKAREVEVAEEARKPKVIPMRRCPVCKSNELDSEYLFHSQLHFYICLMCGGMHMDKKLAKVTFETSIKQHMEGDDGGVKFK